MADEVSYFTLDGKLITLAGFTLKAFSVPYDPYNPLNLPAYTIRLKYKQGTTPSFSKGTGTLVDAEQNIWDLTYENSEWDLLLTGHSNLLEVLGANTTGITTAASMFSYCSSLTSVPLFDTSSVTNMFQMFQSCTSLTSVPLFDTSSVTNMIQMFSYCSSLTSVPLFDTSSVIDMTRMCTTCTSLTTVPLFNTSSARNTGRMFYNCVNVQSGALALYQQASTQANPPTIHSQTFYKCGSDTETGAAELAQIPSDWK